MNEGTDREITTEERVEMGKDWRKDPLESTVEGNMIQMTVVGQTGKKRAAIVRENTEIGTDREDIDKHTQLIIRFASKRNILMH